MSRPALPITTPNSTINHTEQSDDESFQAPYSCSLHPRLLVRTFVMGKHSSRNLNLSLSMLQVTARRLQEIKGLDRNLVSQLFSVIDVVSADTDDVSSSLEE
jgi:hypothetical protein